MNILHQEIREQPSCIERCLAANASALARIAGHFRDRKIQSLALLARGTSRHAALYAYYLFGWQHQMPIQLVQPSLTTFLGQTPVLPRTAMAAVSQSGSSPDLGQVLQRAREQEVYTLAITNTPNSPLTLHAVDVLDIAAGPERAVAATKTYMNQLVALTLLCQSLPSGPSTGIDLSAVPAAVQAMLDLEPLIREVAQDLHSSPAMLIIGRGFHHATACETALKLQELTYIHAMPFTSADFIHGPMALLDDQAVVICLDASSRPNPHFRDIETRAAQTGSRLVVFTHQPERWHHATHMIPLPAAAQLADCLSPMPTIVASQLLAMYVGQAKGLDVVAPRFLQKETLTA